MACSDTRSRPPATPGPQAVSVSTEIPYAVGQAVIVDPGLAHIGSTDESPEFGDSVSDSGDDEEYETNRSRLEDLLSVEIPSHWSAPFVPSPDRSSSKRRISWAVLQSAG